MRKLGIKSANVFLCACPTLLVVGAKEMENATVNVRKRSQKSLGVFAIGEFICLFSKENKPILQ